MLTENSNYFSFSVVKHKDSMAKDWEKSDFLSSFPVA